MADLYTEENGSKKKLLVPLIVLLLCAVSLTGAGYAYNSTVTNDEDVIHIEGLSLELTTGTDTRAPVSSAMFNLNLAYGTHASGIKAINGETGKGFITVDGVTTVQSTDDHPESEFDDGFYVDTYYEGNSVGFCTAPAEIAAASLETAASDSAKTGVFSVGGPYNLTVVNATGTTVGVSLKVAFDNPSLELGKGVKGIYVAITGTIGAVTNGSSEKNVSQVIDLTDVDAQGKISQLITTFESDQSAPTDLTVKTYVVCSDYPSATMPEFSNSADYGFKLTFVAATPEP